MQKTLLLLAVVLTANLSFSQYCVPDAQYTDPGIYPDSATGFVDGYVGQYYEQVVTAIIPTDTVVDVLGVPTTVPITSIDIDTILNLPPNFTYLCEPTSCSFAGGTAACVKIFSAINPSNAEIGNYLLDIQISAIAGVLSQSGSIDYYDIDIIDPNGINEIKNKISLEQNQPNPFNGNTLIKYNSVLNTTVLFVVTDLLGKQVFSSNYNAVSGKNFIEFNGSNLEKGIYLYSITEGNNKITKKMVVR